VTINEVYQKIRDAIPEKFWGDITIHLDEHKSLDRWQGAPVESIQYKLAVFHIIPQNWSLELCRGISATSWEDAYSKADKQLKPRLEQLKEDTLGLGD
jgi:hypothetical protein